MTIPLAHGFKSRQLSRQGRTRHTQDCAHSRVRFSDGNQFVVCLHCHQRAKAAWVLEVQDKTLLGYAVRYSFGAGWRTLWAEVFSPCDPDWGEFNCIPLRQDCESLLEQARQSKDEAMAGELLHTWRTLVWYGSPPGLA